jgi:hypothetical protein
VIPDISRKTFEDEVLQIQYMMPELKIPGILQTIPAGLAVMNIDYSTLNCQSLVCPLSLTRMMNVWKVSAS